MRPGRQNFYYYRHHYPTHLYLRSVCLFFSLSPLVQKKNKQKSKQNTARVSDEPDAIIRRRSFPGGGKKNSHTVFFEFWFGCRRALLCNHFFSCCFAALCVWILAWNFEFGRMECARARGRCSGVLRRGYRQRHRRRCLFLRLFGLKIKLRADGLLAACGLR